MNELQIFRNEKFGEVRTIEENGKMWFVGKDVADILGYTNTPKAIRDHVDDEDKLTERIVLSGQNREVIFINESGLYALIFGSKLKTAKEFKHWVTSEILPSIRKHGAYMTPQTLEQAILNPDTIIKIATALKEEQDKNKALQAVNSSLTVDNTIMRPKAEYFDELVDRNLLTNIRETSKELHVPEKKFVAFLLERKYVYRDKRGKLAPYAQFVTEGLFELKEQYNEKTKWSGTQMLITPKGRETFRLLYIKIAS